jgi:hypothetical protein
MSPPDGDVTEHDRQAGQVMNPALPDDRDNGDAGQDSHPHDEPLAAWPGPGAPARSALGLVVALGLLVVVLALGFVVLLVTEDGSEQTAGRNGAAGADAQASGGNESTAEATPAPAAPQDEAERMIVAALADEVGEDYRGVVSDEEARCMAQAAVDVMGVERVPALGEPGSMSEAEEQLLDAAQANCLDPETAARLGL